MKSYVRYIGKGRFQVQSTGEELQRWATELSAFKFETGKWYRFNMRRDGASMKNYLLTVLDIWTAIHNPKHRPTYYIAKD